MKGDQCPFLHKVAVDCGTGDIRDVVDEDWAAPGGDAFLAVHGSDGVIPLEEEPKAGAGLPGQQCRVGQHTSAGRCPLRGLFSGASWSSSHRAADTDDDDDDDDQHAGARSGHAAWTFRRLLARSIASISFSGLGPPPGFGPPPSKGGRNDENRRRNPSSDATKESKSQKNGRERMETRSKEPGDAETTSSSASVEASVESFKQSKCPLARVPGFHKVVASILTVADPTARNAFKLACPPPIVAMRAALSALPQVRALRPKPLEEKLAAVAAASFMCNLPLGAWREHTRKFSFEWFVAVHASIPFVVSLRKAVVMPKTAIIVTIASAVFGQYVGSRWERRRVADSVSVGSAAAAATATEFAGEKRRGQFDDGAGEADGGRGRGEGGKKLRVQSSSGGVRLPGLHVLRGMAPPSSENVSVQDAVLRSSCSAPRGVSNMFRPLQPISVK